MSLLRQDKVAQGGRINKMEYGSGVGLTKGRPDMVKLKPASQSYFDIEVGKPVWWNGTHWVDATGTSA